MKRVLLGLIAASLLILAAGCSGGEGAGAEGPDVKGTAPTGQKESNGAAIANSPPDRIPEGGIVLRPKDPDDPKFKPDPELSGAGGQN